MPAVRIRIGAALDPGASRVLEPLLAAVSRARTRLKSEGDKAAEDFVGGYRTAPAKTRASFDAITAQARKAGQAQANASHAATEAVIRDLAKIDRATTASMARRESASKVLSNAGRTFGGVVAKGVGVAGTVARSAGVQLDYGGAITRSVDNETKARDIMGQVQLAGGKGPTGGAKGLEGFASNVGDKTAQSAGSVLDVLAEFQAKSNDLKTGQETVAELGMLAKAAGAEFKDVGSAAAFVNAQLEEGPDRAKQLLGIMRAITAQTAAGQIELKDWAKYMPRIASAANAFSGDYSKNIGTLSALAQISVKGGRSNAAEASGSAAALPRDLRKARTLEAFQAEGIDVFADKGKTQMRPVDQLIMESIQKTKGDKARLSKLYPNVVSAAPVHALADIYNKSGGGAKGTDAMKRELSQYDKSISSADVAKVAGDALQTTASKVQVMNNQFDRIAADTLPKLVPAFEQLAPLLTQVAAGFASMAVTIANNPATAITTAIAASIAKAGIETAITNGIASMLAKSSGFTVASATIGITAATIALATAADAKAQGAQTVEGIIKKSGEVLSTAEQDTKDKKPLSPEAIADLRAARNNLQLEIDKGSKHTSWYEPVTQGLNPWSDKTFSGLWSDIGEEQRARSSMGTLENQKKGIDVLLADAATPHKEAADATKQAADKLSAAADKLAAVMPAGTPNTTPGATTGPRPVR